MDNIFAQSRDLFQVPLENKLKNTSEEPYRGYIGPKPGMPLYEGIAIDNVTCPQETQKFRDLMWPHGKSKFWYAPSYLLIHLINCTYVRMYVLTQTNDPNI